jgi:hypothetical protein
MTHHAEPAPPPALVWAIVFPAMEAWYNPSIA